MVVRHRQGPPGRRLDEYRDRLEDARRRVAVAHYTERFPDHVDLHLEMLRPDRRISQGLIVAGRAS